jgi:hypothetical protein
MRQQFKNLDTWRGKLTAVWVCIAPPTALVVVFVAGGVTSNTFIVDAQALSQPRTDTVFDELAGELPSGPGVDGSIPTEQRSQIEVPVTGAVDSPQQPTTGVTGDVSGIPGTVLAAYQKAANDLAVAQPNCGITWPLLAGIGKVESAHASGGRVDANGVTRGKILGPVLDGGPGMSAIADTDQGVYDGDTKWDRAVGPMQFIPGTWKSFGADGNGDGVKDPHNIFDAARAAGDYLCAGGANLKDPAGLVQAVLRYNHSMDYVSTVLRWMQTYGATTVTIPDSTDPISPPDNNGNVQNDPTPPPTTPVTTPPTTPATTPSKTPTLTPTPKPTKTTGPTKGPNGGTPGRPTTVPTRPTVPTSPTSPTQPTTPVPPTDTPTTPPTTPPTDTPTPPVTPPTACKPDETPPPTAPPAPDPTCTVPPAPQETVTPTPAPQGTDSSTPVSSLTSTPA